MHSKQVRRRRAILGLLVAVSLILLTAYFGESADSPLHSVQRGIVEVFSPIQEGASTVLSPVRDIAGWFSDTFHAKSRADQLQKRVNSLTAEVANLQSKAAENAQLTREVGLDQSNTLAAYQKVAAHVILRDPTLWYQTVELDKGSSDGVQVNDPVIGDGALVGKVSLVAANVCYVTLITDHTFAAAAEVQDARGDTGEIVPDVGNPNQLLLQYLNVQPGQPGPAVGQLVYTAGFKYGPLQSLYPRGIPIGTVSNYNQNALYNNGQVTVAPTADLRHVSSVQILLPAQPSGSARAQVP